MESLGTSHSEVGVSVGLGGTDAEVVGFTVHVEGMSSSVVADLHPVDGFLDTSSRASPFGVPIVVASEVSGFMVLGREVVVGLDVSGFHELHVLADVSHAGSHGLLEGSHVVEEGCVGEVTFGGGGGGGQNSGGEGGNESDFGEHYLGFN